MFKFKFSIICNIAKVQSLFILIAFGIYVRHMQWTIEAIMNNNNQMPHFGLRPSHQPLLYLSMIIV